ncbi:MAG: hypothetical protein U0359_01500 [Byssovorax sp.]
MSQRRARRKRCGPSASEDPIVLTVNDDWPAAYCPPPARGMLGRSAHSSITGCSPPRPSAACRSRRSSTSRTPSAGRMLGAGAPLPTGVVEPQGVDLSVFSPRAPRPMRAAP